MREKFGVGPEAVTDVQGLMGDSSDNIPGIRGIGPKTASALIAHFGSLEALLERSDEIEGMSIRGAKGVMAKVEGGIEAARVSKLLATVRNDIDLDLELDDLVLGSAENVALLELAERLEMGRLSARLRKALGAEAAPPPKPPWPAPPLEAQASHFTLTSATGVPSACRYRCSTSSTEAGTPRAPPTFRSSWSCPRASRPSRGQSRRVRRCSTP